MGICNYSDLFLLITNIVGSTKPFKHCVKMNEFWGFIKDHCNNFGIDEYGHEYELTIIRVGDLPIRGDIIFHIFPCCSGDKNDENDIYCIKFLDNSTPEFNVASKIEFDKVMIEIIKKVDSLLYATAMRHI